MAAAASCTGHKGKVAAAVAAAAQQLQVGLRHAQPPGRLRQAEIRPKDKKRAVSDSCL